MRKRIRLILPTLLLLVFGCAAAQAVRGAAGGADDPLVSLRYLYDTLAPALTSLFQKETGQALTSLEEDWTERLDAVRFPEHDGWEYAGSYLSLEAIDGGSLRLDSLSSFLLLDGTVRLNITGGEVIDLNTGDTCANGSLLQPNHRYFTAEDGTASLRVYSETASGMVDGYYSFHSSGSFSPQEQYLDVTEEHWASDYIWQLTEAGVVNGMEIHRYAPADTVTRAAFVTILGRICEFDPLTALESGFTDVTGAEWFGPYVAWASASGIVNGFEDGSFGPLRAITREQMAAMILRLCDSLGAAPAETASAACTDLDTVSDWAQEAVDRVLAYGLMNGRDDGRFDPKGTANRAEIAAVACRYLEQVQPPVPADAPEDTASDPDLDTAVETPEEPGTVITEVSSASNLIITQTEGKPAS